MSAGSSGASKPRQHGVRANGSTAPKAKNAAKSKAKAKAAKGKK